MGLWYASIWLCLIDANLPGKVEARAEWNRLLLFSVVTVEGNLNAKTVGDHAHHFGGDRKGSLNEPKRKL